MGNYYRVASSGLSRLRGPDDDPHALRRSARLGLFPFPRLTEPVFPRMAAPNLRPPTSGPVYPGPPSSLGSAGALRRISPPSGRARHAAWNAQAP